MTNKEAYDLLKNTGIKSFTERELHSLGIDEQNILELQKSNKLVKYIDKTWQVC